MHFTKYLFDILKLDKLNKQLKGGEIFNNLNVEKDQKINIQNNQICKSSRNIPIPNGNSNSQLDNNIVDNMKRDSALPIMPEMELVQNPKSKIKILEVKRDFSKNKNLLLGKSSSAKKIKSGIKISSNKQLTYKNKPAQNINFNPPQELFYKPPINPNKRNYGGLDYLTNLSTRRNSSRKDQQSLSFSKEFSQPHITTQSQGRNTFRQTFNRTKEREYSKEYKEVKDTREIRSSSNLH